MEMTYAKLARRAYSVARSHWTHALPRLREITWALSFVTLTLGVGAAFGVQIGATRANARHVESLRRIIPVAEAALAAHERALEATEDTLEMLPGDGP